MKPPAGAGAAAGANAATSHAATAAAGAGATSAGSSGGDEEEPPVMPKRTLKRQLTKHVVTRWYRAPELILLQVGFGEAAAVACLGLRVGLVALKGGEKITCRTKREGRRNGGGPRVSRDFAQGHVSHPGSSISVHAAVTSRPRGVCLLQTTIKDHSSCAPQHHHPDPLSPH